MTLRNGFYMVVKSTGKQTEVSDANRQERRQKTGSNEMKQEKKGGKKRATPRTDILFFILMFESAFLTILCIAEYVLLIN